MKSASIDWSSPLLALALAFAFVFSPLAGYFQIALGSSDRKFDLFAFIAAFFVIWMTLRSRRTWLELPPSRRQGGASAFAISQLVRAVVFVGIIVGGTMLIFAQTNDWMRGASDWATTTVEMLVAGVCFKASTMASDAVGDPIWRNARIEKTRAPDGAALTGLKMPFVVGKARADGRVFIAIIAASGAVCLLVYASLFVAARAGGAALPAPTWAIAGFVLLLVALRYWWECLPYATVNASEIRPRMGRAFHWWDVAQIEEARVSKFMDGDELRLIFRDVKGAILWQLPVDELERGDKRELWRLFPELDKQQTN